MKKIADNYYEVEERREVSADVECKMTIDKIDGEFLDTKVNLVGEFWVAGSERQKFCKELGELIERYRI